MRYLDGGGLSPAARERRETLRLQAARLFAEDVAPVEVAARLRVSTKSAYQWRRRWRAGGDAALASTGPGGASCRLSDAQLQRLRAELERGPAEHGWADQRWTLARVTTLIGRLCHLRYTPRGTAYLLHRMGFSAQVARHRAAAEGADRGRARAHPGGRGVGPGRAGVDGRAGLLSARLPGPAVLPDPGAPPPPRGAAQLLAKPTTPR